MGKRTHRRNNAFNVSNDDRIAIVVNKHAVRWSMSTVMPKNIYIRIATLAKNQSQIVIPQQHRKLYIRVVRERGVDVHGRR